MTRQNYHFFNTIALNNFLCDSCFIVDDTHWQAHFVTKVLRAIVVFVFSVSLLSLATVVNRSWIVFCVCGTVHCK